MQRLHDTHDPQCCVRKYLTVSFPIVIVVLPDSLQLKARTMYVLWLQPFTTQRHVLTCLESLNPHLHLEPDCPNAI